MSRYELEDRSGNFILGVGSEESLRRVLRFMRANDKKVDAKLIIWATDQNGDIYPLDPSSV